MGYNNIVVILADRGANLNINSKLGFTPLHYACKEGQFQCAKTLIEKGADVNAMSSIGFTPLYVAAQGNFVDIVKLLLKHGADHRRPLRVGRFIPLHVAQKQGHENVVRILSEAN
ncbi:uncharacterized protein TRIADDRAFT_55756 [Trichoplax adhaerens]|uniref:Uncharacterized protein n=1 Tax=Trichoplax adhaerens TaxID=10228 RepID=B3RVS3_TRIAD|nr:hypothetical protein TRIADDRAFT_55756 [Trichoplax adhaerens]EDV26048.1 hypothetical protein TRIADDRAFT_55756 [Trichoplax adhaerens]|eukprot:XP_002112081.1 hypothetical protein TRIADDRAFT_55756 [Trichoplax adhaerens]